MQSPKGLPRRFQALALTALLSVGLAACQPEVNSRAAKPIPSETLALMEKKGTSKNAPMLIRAYKKEAELEIWKQKPDGEYAFLKKYPMCRWSGQLGPKTREGDRQVPEGFYAITPGQMNPNSSYYLSFNVGYPNAYDRAFGRDGGSIMVHGACSSAGCFSMTDEQIAEIYAIAREAFAGGQRAIQMQSLPFRMNAENLAKHRADPNMAFWRNLKEGADYFEVAKTEPSVGVCGRRYVFNATPANGQRLDASSACPSLKYDESLRSQVAAKQQQDEQKVAELASSGVKAVKVVYADGGQHPEFADKSHDVSRPDALAKGPVEIALDDKKGKKTPGLVQIATIRTTGEAAGAKPVIGDAARPVQASALAPEPKVETPAANATLDSLLGFMSPSKPAPAPVAAAVEQKTEPTKAIPAKVKSETAKPAAKPAAKPQPVAAKTVTEKTSTARPPAHPAPKAQAHAAAKPAQTQIIAGANQSLPAGFALTTTR